MSYKLIRVPDQNGNKVAMWRHQFHYATDYKNESVRLYVGSYSVNTALKTKAICNLFAGDDWAPLHFKIRHIAADDYNDMQKQGRVCINPLHIRRVNPMTHKYDGDDEASDVTRLNMGAGATIVVPAPMGLSWQ